MSRGARRSGGAALVMVIWVLTALSLILSEFVFASRVSLNAARNQKTAAVGYYLALGAYYLALDEIGQEYQYLLPGGDGGVIFVRQGETTPEDLSVSLRSGEVPGGGKYFYQIKDEESKMNINRAERNQLVTLLRMSGLPIGAERDTIADSILDWRDQDNLHRLNGAEDDYYRSLTPPYHAKNGNLDTAGELLLVKGVTEEVYFGAEGREGGRLADLVTVWGERPNYNTAPREVLAAWINEREADRLTRDREARPYTDMRGRSYHFTITAWGQAEGSDTRRVISALVRRRDAQGRTGAAVTLLQWDDSPTASPALDSPESAGGGEGRAAGEGE